MNFPELFSDDYQNATMKKENISDTANYDFRFGDDLVKIGNDLYVKGSFCDVSESGSGDDFVINNV